MAKQVSNRSKRSIRNRSKTKRASARRAGVRSNKRKRRAKRGPR